MKRNFLIAAILLLSAVCSAQTSEAILSKLGSASISMMNEAFKETRTASAAAGGQKTTLTGQMVYKNGTYLSMVYDNGDVFLIDGDKMTIKKGDMSQVFDTTKNLLMKSLSHTLIYAFKGTLDKLAVEQDANIKAEKSGNFYVVTLTAKKKAARGYNRITTRYNVSDCHIHDMVMEEFSGASTFYSLK